MGKVKRGVPDDLRVSEVLALDMAIHTGYFSVHASGTWDFTERKGNDWKQHKSFRDELIDFVKAYGIRLIVAEELILVGRRLPATRKLGEFRGILLEVCDELDLCEPVFVNPMSAKKVFTGNGRADKGLMMQCMGDRFGRMACDDNEADACAMFYFFCKQQSIVA